MTLKKQDSNIPVQYQPGFNPYMPGTTVKDFTPPRMKLVAAGSAEVAEGTAKPGEYFFGTLGLAKAELNIAVLQVKSGRVYWGDEGLPVCSSNDNIVPRPGGEYESYAEEGAGGCKACPQYEIGKDGCQQNYDLLVQDLDDDFTAIWQVSSWSGRQAIQNFNSAIQVATGGIPFGRVVHLKSVSKQNAAKQTYYVPQLLVQKEVPENYDRLKALADSLIGVEVKTPEEEAPAAPSPRRRGRAAKPEEKPPAESTVEGDDTLY